MKKLVLSILALAATVFAGNNAAARNVTVAEAAQAAAYFMECNTMHEGVKASDLILVHEIQGEVGTAVYCFNVSDWGWVMISASTAIDPIMGYSDYGTLSAWDELAPAMRWWCEGYAGIISDIQKADLTEKYDDNPEWTELFNRSVKSNTKDDPRVVLLSSFWGQGSPHNPSYNYFCPFDSTTNRYCYVGCVATAMAQIVRYYGYPIVPKGRKNYYTDELAINVRLKFDTLRFDYSQMPDRLFASAPYSQVYNVAMLSYACGVAVEMDYTPEGSGSQSRRVVTGMYNHFKYAQSEYVERSQLGTAGFISALRSDLLMRRPVYMSGSSPVGSGADAAGHAWVCCGYRTDSENYYYMNWGWTGSGDGFFNLYENSLNGMLISSQGYSFINNQGIITGLVPPSADSTDIDFMTPINVVEDNTVLAPAYPNPAVFNVTLPYAVTSEAEMQVYSIDGKIVATRRLTPGNGHVALDVSGMPAGIYIYRVGGKSGKFIVR